MKQVGVERSGLGRRVVADREQTTQDMVGGLRRGHPVEIPELRGARQASSWSCSLGNVDKVKQAELLWIPDVALFFWLNSFLGVSYRSFWACDR